MPIFDNDGATNYEIGKVFDNDGTTSYQIGKVYDYDGTVEHLIYTGSENLLANAGVTNLHANCYTPDSGGNEMYSSSISFSWGDIDNLNIIGSFAISRKGNGDWHSADKFIIQILVNGSWQNVWVSEGFDGGWATGTWGIDITINTENYTGAGQIRCYCSSSRLTDHSITNYLDIDISSLTTNV